MALIARAEKNTLSRSFMAAGSRPTDGRREDEDLQGHQLRKVVAGVLQAPRDQLRLPDEGGGAGAGVPAHGAQGHHPPLRPAEAGVAPASSGRPARELRRRRRRQQRAGDPVREQAGADAEEPEPQVAPGQHALAGDGAGEGVQPDEDADDQDEGLPARRGRRRGEITPQDVFLIVPFRSAH